MKKNVIMKRVLSFLLLVCMLLTAGAYAEDTDVQYFRPTTTNILDYTAKDWMESGKSRALIFVLLALDFMSDAEQEFDMTSMYNGTAYVGREGNIIAAGYVPMNSDECIVLLYDTNDKEQAGYMIYKKTQSTITNFLETALESVCTEGYYKLDAEDIAETVKSLHEALVE